MTVDLHSVEVLQIKFDINNRICLEESTISGVDKLIIPDMVKSDGTDMTQYDKLIFDVKFYISQSLDEFTKPDALNHNIYNPDDQLLSLHYQTR